MILCPIHEWRLIFKISKNNLSSFALWKTLQFVRITYVKINSLKCYIDLFVSVINPSQINFPEDRHKR
jgi:hypothetical protein